MGRGIKMERLFAVVAKAPPHERAIIGGMLLIIVCIATGFFILR